MKCQQAFRKEMQSLSGWSLLRFASKPQNRHFESCKLSSINLNWRMGLLASKVFTSKDNFQHF